MSLIGLWLLGSRGVKFTQSDNAALQGLKKLSSSLSLPARAVAFVKIFFRADQRELLDSRTKQSIFWIYSLYS